MVMLASLMAILVPVIGGFLLAAARQIVLRSGRPAWLRRRLAGGPSSGGASLGAALTEELHTMWNGNKNIQLEQRRVDLTLQDNQHDGAPPRMGIDLDGGRAVIRRTR
ncbi:MULTISPECIES: DUF6191 domain-containing protein [Streptomyces]|uniref:DUF6191 domain-containing protein n=1 Tax=Streptomyces TaxID=1883 RepID=UPI001F2E74F9|nr:DUF6191 domain-containing protein [Streptomyces noursei]MCE4943508.1 DUF6191 domain-containing protein [Streptomyces noursei]